MCTNHRLLCRVFLGWCSHSDILTKIAIQHTLHSISTEDSAKNILTAKKKKGRCILWFQQMISCFSRWNQVTSFDGLRESWQSISLANTIRAATDILRTGLPWITTWMDVWPSTNKTKFCSVLWNVNKDLFSRGLLCFKWGTSIQN